MARKARFVAIGLARLKSVFAIAMQAAGCASITEIVTSSLGESK
jgi:hypothetical protein